LEEVSQHLYACAMPAIINAPELCYGLRTSMRTFHNLPEGVSK
jgi:hypothetical protein